MKTYNYKQAEDKWESLWNRDNVYEAVDFSDKPKKYILAEFPYPSGATLHAGHMMRYTMPDIYSRYLRMQGYNVLFPMGWDAFGLPAENYAIKTGVSPSITTKKAIEAMKTSFMRMGYGFDWKREIDTTDPKYYKWTQWLFLQFFTKGLAEYKNMPIWWCEQLKTVLSDEEVLTNKNGDKVSERGEHPVERKMLSQWVLKITKYADKLLEGLEEVDFPDSIRTAQTNWIGKSNGAYATFDAKDINIEVFTTRPDTLFGVTFLALSAEYSQLDRLLPFVENKTEVQSYILEVKKQSDLERQINKDKTGILLKGITAKHPLAEITRDIPIFVTNYVLNDYGTGAVMGVPAHDERDNAFAKKYKLEIIEVIKDIKAPGEETDSPLFTGDGQMINSGEYNGISSKEFFDKVIDRLKDINKGKRATTYKLRDWIFSRQRYWGEPIPLIHFENGVIKAICEPNDPESVKNNLPLTLPDLPDYSPSSDGSSPLERDVSWVNVTDEDGHKGKRETNTMPNWAGSCWYFIRYLDPKNDVSFADMDKMKYWLPVDRYFGGAEHTTLHLLYSRFWYRFLFDLGLVPTKEPYSWRLNGGMLLAPDGKKMSKSKGNGVEPMELVDKYGADALRLAIGFLGPYEDTYPWNENGMKATSRIINNIFELSQKISSDKNDITLVVAYNKLLKNVTEMTESLKMNTAVSEIMIFINETKKHSFINSDIWNGFLRLIAPYAPFIAEELWQETVIKSDWIKTNSVHMQQWPSYDPSILENKQKIIPVQINGKVRAEITVLDGDTKDIVISKAMESEKVKSYLTGKEPKNIIYVEGKILSIAV